MIREKVLSNFIWIFLEKFSAQAVTFIVSIVLARIMEPTAYGTVALITVFINVFSVFVDCGFSSALIQKKDADDIDFSTVFYFNICCCSVLYVVLFLLAPPIARFYNDYSLTALIRVLGVSIIVLGLKATQMAYVSRNLIFKNFFLATLLGTVISAIVGIIMAIKNLGVWALVTQSLLNTVIDTSMLWITVQWRPKKVFSFTRLRQLLNFGLKVFFAGLFDTFRSEIRSLVIGKFYTTADLAFFNRGQNFPRIIVSNINTSIDHVILPVIANEQDDMIRVKNMLRRAVKISAYFMWPMMIGLAACGDTIVRIILTDKWLESAWYMKVFCIYFAFYPILSTNGEAIKAIGRSDVFLKMNMINGSIGLITTILTVFISVQAMAVSFIANAILGSLIIGIQTQKLIHYSIFDQIKDVAPPIVLSLFMGFLISLIGKFITNIYLLLALQIIMGTIIYACTSMLLNLDSMNYCLDILKNFIIKQNH